MLIFGDDQRKLYPLTALQEVRGRLRFGESGAGIARHACAVETFILLAELAQGYADWEMHGLGHDDRSHGQDAFYLALRDLGLWIRRSWKSGFSDQPALDLKTLRGLGARFLPLTVTVKRPEGYAFYGLYPELYLEAAADLPRDSVIIGLRSIGTGLAALVAAACGSETIFTLRPTGHPFSRGVNAGPQLSAFVMERSHRPFVIVDEGPGLAGSSFGGVADWLQALGVPESMMIFMPSHPNPLGPEASAAHRERWDRADKRLRTFEQVFTKESPQPVHSWFEDVTGPLTAPVMDLSGGLWAAGRESIPTSPWREARNIAFRGRRADS